MFTFLNDFEEAKNLSYWERLEFIIITPKGRSLTFHILTNEMPESLSSSIAGTKTGEGLLFNIKMYEGLTLCCY